MAKYSMGNTAEVLFVNKKTGKIKHSRAIEAAPLEYRKSRDIKIFNDDPIYEKLKSYIGKSVHLEQKYMNGEIIEGDYEVNDIEGVIVLSKSN